jgi:hypothetical protein
MVFLFQLGMVKYTLNLGYVATITNSLMLLGLSIMAVRNISGRTFLPAIWLFYLIPGILVYAGYFQNISRSMVANVGAASSLGLLIPWAAYLSVPFLIRSLADSETIWRFFYRCMLLVCGIGLIEYLLAFNGLLPLRIIETPLGTFLSGGLTVFHMLEDQSPYYRFYAIFPEPGTFAMYLLPAILYALVYRKYVGLTLFSISLYLTGSLGGVIALVLLALVYIYGRLRQLRYSIGVCVLAGCVLAAGLAGYFSADFAKAYAAKNQSAEVRENNVFGVIYNLPALIVDHPLGFELTGESMSNIDSKDYFGSNFALGNALATGGFMSLSGYFAMLTTCLVISLLSLARRIEDIDHQVIFPSLLVAFIFVIQRATVMDSAIFAFLFSPSIIRYLRVVRVQTTSSAGRRIEGGK